MSSDRRLGTDPAMRRIAVSGHRGLSDRTVQIVSDAIRTALSQQPGTVIGLSCLADGADQIFARAVVEHGGAIEAVIPAERYRAGLPEETLLDYDRLLTLASVVHRLPFVESTPEAHMAGSLRMLDHADELWEVWDGEPARGYGGTADVVARARDRRIPVRVIWPAGAARA